MATVAVAGAAAVQAVAYGSRSSRGKVAIAMMAVRVEAVAVKVVGITSSTAPAIGAAANTAAATAALQDGGCDAWVGTAYNAHGQWFNHTNKMIPGMVHLRQSTCLSACEV